MSQLAPSVSEKEGLELMARYPFLVVSPTGASRAQRRAEAEAIYQLLRVLNEDLKRERGLTLAGRVTGVATDRTDG